MLPFLIAKRRTVAQLKAAIHADDAQISYAATQLSYTRITAPISGRVGARLVDPGNIIQASDPAGLVVINQIDPITVEFTVPGDSFEAINQAWQNAEKPLTRSEEHTSELQSLMRISYAVFRLKKKNK